MQTMVNHKQVWRTNERNVLLGGSWEQLFWKKVHEKRVRVLFGWVALISHWLPCCWAKRKLCFLLEYVKWAAKSSTCLRAHLFELSDPILSKVFLHSFSEDILNFGSIIPIIKDQELENKLSLSCYCLAGTHGTVRVNKKFILEPHTKIPKIKYKIILKHYPRISRYLLN